MALLTTTAHQAIQIVCIFAQTNQSVCAPFRDTYLRYGLESNGKRGIQLADSIALFGIPISAPQQVVLADGTYVSQWFDTGTYALQKH